MSTVSQHDHDREHDQDSGQPRAASLDALLREIDALRRTFETDLSLAAAALDAGSPDVASELIDGDLEALASFEEHALVHLGEQAQVPARVVRLRDRRAVRLLSAALPLTAAAAAAVLVTVSLVSSPTDGPPARPLAVAPAATPEVQFAGSYAALAALAAAVAPDSATQAADRVNADVVGLTDQISNDPATATAALGVLHVEQQLLSGRSDASALRALIDRNLALTQKILDSLPLDAVKAVVSSLPSLVPALPSLPALVPTPTTTPTKATPTKTGAPAKSAKPSTSPTPTAPKTSNLKTATPSPSVSTTPPTPKATTPTPSRSAATPR